MNRFMHQVNLSSQVTVRVLTLPSKAACCNRSKYGYISKVYGLLNSSFSTAIFFDSDVWFCEGWERSIDNALMSNKHAKVIWTLEQGDASEFLYSC
jgi:hypothetical protein